MLDQEAMSVTYPSPSYETYQELHSRYADNFYCSCSEIKQPYSAFLTLIPKLHSVCTSAFIEDIWLRQLILDPPSAATITSIDWHYMSNGLFQTLLALCDLASITIADALLGLRVY